MSTQLNEPLARTRTIRLTAFPTPCKITLEQANKTVIQSMTVAIRDTFRIRNPQFKYETEYNPKRVLTHPSEGVKNGGYDNANSDYILYVHDYIGPEEDPHKYMILDMLGSGTFGQVVKCENLRTGELVALKIVKNKRLYTKQGIIEDDILTHLNSLGENDNILSHKESFMHRNHVCLVFELLSVNLYEVLKHRGYKGLPIDRVQDLSKQILETLVLLKSVNIIHCDLKPENILLKTNESLDVKIIDYGSSCYESQQSSTYIQSRFYRAPEVLLGFEYTTAIDMWSFGCIVAELFLGIPLLPGNSEYNLLSRLTDTIGHVPDYMINQSEKGRRYYNYKNTLVGASRYTLKGIDQYSRESKKQETPSKHYFTSTKLEDIIMNSRDNKQSSSFYSVFEHERQSHKHLLDLLKKCLEIDPRKRITPEQALKHPFVTGNCFNRFFPFSSM